jgi:hypothetical protein
MHEPMHDLVPIAPATAVGSPDARLLVPTLIVGAGDRAARRFLEFFAATIRHKHTCMAYNRAVVQFFAWCDQHRLGQLVDIEPLHVAAYIEALQKNFAKPSVKQHLAAIRMLFDWLVTGGMVATNPAHAVRGPRHVVRRGKTPVLTPEAARTLLDGIDTSTVVGRRDRALISVMTFTFARIGAVVGITGLTTDDQYGTLEHGYQANRRDFQANPINAVVVRQWQGKDDGPGGNTVFLTNAPVEKPLRVFDDDDDRRLIENCCSKDAKQQWDLGHPPQKTARAVRVQVVFTVLMFAVATAYRLQCEREALGGAPVGWQRWRRQLLEQVREKVIVFAQGYYGIFHLAEYSRLLGVKRKDVPPGVGTRQEILAKYRLLSQP